MLQLKKFHEVIVESMQELIEYKFKSASDPGRIAESFKNLDYLMEQCKILERSEMKADDIKNVIEMLRPTSILVRLATENIAGAYRTLILRILESCIYRFEQRLSAKE